MARSGACSKTSCYEKGEGTMKSLNLSRATSYGLAVLFIAGSSLTTARDASAQAAAPAGKYTKREIEVQGVPQTELTKPVQPPKDAKKQTGPVLTADQFVGQRQEKIVRLNKTTIDKFQRLLRVTDDDDPQKADLHFRIAELYDEQQRYNTFQARSLDQKIFDAKTQA